MSSITRRQALAGLGAAAAASVASTASAEGAPCTFADTVAWDAEYDVVVVGFGGAGAASAIVAADEGSRVLLTDKAPLHHEGGNTRYSGQFLKHFDEGELGLAYVRRQSDTMDHMTDEINELIWRGCNENLPWLAEKGILDSFFDSQSVEYPDFPGGISAGISSMALSPDCKKAFWEAMRAAVVARLDSIDVWLGSPALHLVQDPATRTVVGVVVEHGGAELRVRALNGVVMACGGFENNDFMMENFQNRSQVYPYGTEYNTGDGIAMVTEVGAQLWHTSTLSGPFFSPLVGDRCYYESMYQNFYVAEPCILVGRDGNRFCTDKGWSRHGHRPVGGDWLPQQAPEVMWAVFDETARASGNHACVYFSKDLSEEIASGQIVVADTIEELAAAIGLDDEGYYVPDDGVVGWSGYDEGARPSGLVKTVERYNSYCKMGYDPEFWVKPEYLAPIATPPFYAIRMYSTCVNTQGGGKRDLECRILDAFDEPIPHLYGAGEFGSFYGGVYDGGGNLAECLFSGRLAGAGAAAPKEPLPSVPGLIPVEPRLAEYGSDPLEDPAAEPESEDETVVTVTGIGGQMQVGVTISDGAVTAVRVASCGETPAIGGRAINSVPPAIVAANSPDVDGATGATVTSDAIKRAVRIAMEMRGVEPGAQGEAEDLAQVAAGRLASGVVAIEK